jgi:hypothetical protein
MAGLKEHEDPDAFHLPDRDGCGPCGASSNSARLFRLRVRRSGDEFGGLALVANEAREFFQSDPRRLDSTIDIHSLPEVAVIDNARDLMRESRICVLKALSVLIR